MFSISNFLFKFYMHCLNSYKKFFFASSICTETQPNMIKGKVEKKCNHLAVALFRTTEFELIAV